VRGKGLPHTSQKVTRCRVDIMRLLLVSGYTESRGGSLLFFVSINTKSIQKSIKNGFINMFPFFIVFLTSLWKRYHLSVEKGIFLWISMYSNVS